jgi:hypothetical protein
VACPIFGNFREVWSTNPMLLKNSQNSSSPNAIWLHLALDNHCGLTSIAIDKNIVHIPLLVFKEHILTDRIVSEVNNMASRHH